MVKWKTFQERNLVRSAIATQKMIVGNHSPTKLIFIGKLAGTAVTTTIGLTARFTCPDQMNNMDKWMGKHIARWMGDKGIESQLPASHAEKLVKQNSELAVQAR